MCPTGPTDPLDLTLTGEKRALLLDHLAEVRAFMAGARAGNWLEALSLGNRTASALTALYFERLPRPVMATCPFDGKPLVRAFDPWGLDGPWWDPAAQPTELPSCTHFCLTRGALHLNGRPPRAGAFECRPGPEVPYVLPRLLEMPGMVAVIGRIDVGDGYIAYPVSYFAEARPPVDLLAAGWGRHIHTWEDELGAGGYVIDNEAWDFDLNAWIQRGKVRWCPPGGGNLSLNDPAAGGACPYLDLPGARENRRMRGDEAWSAALPEGTEISPYDG